MLLIHAGADTDQKQNPHEVANHTLSARRISYLTAGFGVPEQETPLHPAGVNIDTFARRVQEMRFNRTHC